jgi:4-nitrophenyl phosphatase
MSEKSIAEQPGQDLAGLRKVRGLVIDMDGVLWRGDEAVPGLARFIATLRKKNIRFILATNNNTQTPANFAEKARRLGAPVFAEEVLTATTATIYYLRQYYPAGTHLYAVGEKALKDQLVAAGFILSDKDADAVVAALDRELTYEMIKHASLLIQNGAAFIGANPDVAYPTPEGLVPGSGMVLAAIQATTGCAPMIIGKPETGMFQIAMERMHLNQKECASLGDRLDTDIAGGQRAGLKSILVLSGVTKMEDLASSSIRPDWVFLSIAEFTDALEK